MTNQSFDLVVIGGGPGGYVAAIRAAQLGLKTACVEGRKTLGGTCLNVGCIPSKALLEVSHKFHDAAHGFSALGIEVSKPKIDVKKLIENKNKIVEGLTGGIAGLFKKNKVTLVNGYAKFLSKNQIEVKKPDGSKEVIEAKNFIIATGSEVAGLPGVEIDEKTIVSSTGALDLLEVPKKMIVIGAGVIGLEMASVWGRFGAEIEVVEYLDKITPAMDLEVSKQLQKILEKQGFKFKLSTKVVSVKKDKKGAVVEVEPAAGGAKETLNADIVLVAIGRKPNTANLGLETIGIKTNTRGFIENHHLKTSVENIYVIGDCTTGAMLAHKAEDEGVMAAELIAGKAGHINYDCIPNVIYTYPEVASVGKTEEELKVAGIAYNVGKFPMMANSRARATEDSQGFVKILACAKTDRILGAHMIAREAGNMIHEIVVAMEFGGSAEDIARTCHAHPTYNEAVKEAALGVEKRTIHI
ncbi:MAG: dihydrolipoyl dehydrogenase [Rickettsiaceae bacterium]|jgi:dihydrolipoamide dehydrogenase|nr:dihydrolipoyl dehydrogenase [Rickettsiaceae bacterium]